MIFDILVFGFSFLSRNPPVGAEYHAHFKIPLIGTQNIDFKIDTRSKGNIHFYGIIEKKDIVSYNIDRKGNVNFVFGAALQRFMLKYKCEIKGAMYDYVTDHAKMLLNIRPIRFTTEIILHRTNVETPCS